MGIPTQGVFALKRKTSTLVAVFALAMLAASAAWFGQDLVTGEKTVENRSAILERHGAIQAQTAKDSDGDGLKDWEETIWQTDPEKFDSDGDTTADGAEIAANRDPLKPAPGDALASLPKYIASGDAPAGADNVTAALTETLLASGVLGAIDAEGNVVSTDFLNRLALPPNLDPARTLAEAASATRKDIRVLTTSEAGAVRAYFEAVAATYARHIGFDQRSDLAILSKAIYDGDYGGLTALEADIASLDRLIRDIRGLGVPEAYADVAVKELNYLLQTKKALEIIRNTEADPLATLIILPRRIALLDEMAQFHLAVSRELHERNIFSTTRTQ